MSKLKLHLDADTSVMALHHALTKNGHDVTCTPNDWMPEDISDHDQLLKATEQGRCIFSFKVQDFAVLPRQFPQHRGILLATQRSWTLSELFNALDRVLTETQAEDWKGRVGWLNQWR
ncbi:MAG: DUF5615 family PIN-like protein [Cyanobacteria bacterium P01_A01_bin.114]